MADKLTMEDAVMELSEYSLKELLLSALRAEMDSKAYYEGVAERVQNFLLRDRLKFLAGEEEKHARYFRKTLEERYPGEDITPPCAWKSPTMTCSTPKDDEKPFFPLSTFPPQAGGGPPHHFAG